MGMGWYERVISMDGRLQGKARSDRRLLFLISSIVGFVQSLLLMVLQHWPLGYAVDVMSVACHVGMAALCVCGVHLTHNIVCAYIMGIALVIVLADMNRLSMGSQPGWPVFVLLADLSLVVGLGSRFATGLTAVAALWVLISTSETVLRFGLLDLPGSAPDSVRWERILKVAECTDPPCPVGAADGVFQAQTSLLVLLIDFAATRGFAESAEKEKASMARTIDTVEAIAQLLAGYDVDTVAEMLEEADAEGRLPAAMHEALHRLEQNLRAYRPYLPKSCLPAQQDAGGAEGSTYSQSIESMSSDLTSISRSTSSSECTDVRYVTAMKALGILKITQSTLLVVNTCNALACLEQDTRTFTSFFEILLAKTMSAVESRQGLVDLFVGDRILASFNTSRPSLMHTTAAVGAAQEIVQAVSSCNTQLPTQDTGRDGDLRVNIGAASGRVLCGDTGCAEMRRFSLLGVLPALACGMERAARAFGLDVVCNTALRKETEHEYVLLLVPRRVRLVKQNARGCEDSHTAVQVDSNSADTCFCVYALLVQDCEDSAQDGEDGEWIYHVGKAAAEWEPYNVAMRAFLSGSGAQKAGEIAGKHHIQAQSTISLLGHTTPLAVHV